MCAHWAGKVLKKLGLVREEYLKWCSEMNYLAEWAGPTQPFKENEPINNSRAKKKRMDAIDYTNNQTVDTGEAGLSKEIRRLKVL